MTPARARAQILAMKRKGYSYSHVLNTSIALEHYCRMRGAKLSIGRAKKPRRLLRGQLSEAEVSRLIQAATDLRRRAIIVLLAFSGLRNAELCRLDIEDVDLGGNTVRVVAGKGHKDRHASIPAECSRTIVDYLAVEQRPANAPLFVTCRHGNRLKTQDVRKIVRTLARKAGIDKRVYPHLLRHSLATNMLSRGASLLLIKNQLGHEFVETTMIYIASAPERMRREYDFYRPAYI